ncbi:hypothetical protein [Kineothrix sp. MB12-C1]|uniref:hypothetical protein n=1 Tax=Kineothrix sp. MB12-C1 TaxID=3070215 RepID=UPI0027D2B797|nr:hypothetical protein [Kineothrix sp. MB12-C1]WMC91220.1 hypothetical protein RBB56_10020 [Kineothrix sp. MB12-C1]
MSKKYDISKKSDMKKLFRDMEKKVSDIQADYIGKLESSGNGVIYPDKCPNCHKDLGIMADSMFCPFCNAPLQGSNYF